MLAHLLWSAFCSNKCDITVQTGSRSHWGSFNEGVWRHIKTHTHAPTHLRFNFKMRVCNSLKADGFSPLLTRFLNFCFFFGEGGLVGRFHHFYWNLNSLHRNKGWVRVTSENKTNSTHMVKQSEPVPVARWARLAALSASLWMISKAVFSYYSLFFARIAMSLLQRPIHMHINHKCAHMILQFNLSGELLVFKSTAVKGRLRNPGFSLFFVLSPHIFCFSPFMRNTLQRETDPLRGYSFSRENENRKWCIADLTSFLTVRKP